eukprot:TRINITY_DN5423_c0_g1_i3.p1 TRINITY_DN5423_c0_g1~~TRINITY_DN5423_c0_g1_i3.p1  ORF type:complete len:995 (+),score=71.21 TRINITY_DN5423_c0_g1_i3:1644-4628(+)
MRIQEYDVTIQHRPGKRNANADAPSRLPQQAELDAARSKEPADEQWPDSVASMDAPPSGVRFADESTVRTHEVADVNSCRGYTVDARFGPAFKFNEAVAISGAVAARLAALSVAEIAQLLDRRLDDSTVEDAEVDEFDVDPAGSEPVRKYTGSWEQSQAQRLLKQIACDRRRSSGSKKAKCSVSTAQRAVSTNSLEEGELVEVDALAEADEADEPPDGEAVLGKRKKTLPRPEVIDLLKQVAEGGSSATPAMLSRAAFLEVQKADGFCQSVSKMLTEGDIPEGAELVAHVLTQREQYTIEEDGLLVHGATSHPKRGMVLLQWVVPIALRTLVMRLGHDDASAMHCGIGATHTRIFERYFWPGMGADIRVYVQSCMTCLQRKRASTTQYKQWLAEPVRMWQRLNIDITEPGIKSAAGHRYVLTIVETRSGFVWLFAMHGQGAENVTPHLLTVFLEIGALVEELCSDKGKVFLGNVVSDLCKAFKVKRIETSAYHPQTNGVAEHANGRAKKALASWVSAQQTNWHEGLELVQFVLRTTPREETGLTPFFCVYGREASLPHDAFMHENGGRKLDLHEEIERKLDMLELADKVVSKALQLRAQKITKRNEAVKRAVQFAVGDYVMIRLPKQRDRSAALDAKYVGPWQIEARTGESGLSFICRMMGRRVRHTTAHVENMKPFHMRPDAMLEPGVHAALSPLQVEELADGEKLYRVLDRQVSPSGSWQYKWQSKDGKSHAWVSEDDMLGEVMPWTLDTFHALYELRNAGKLPAYAIRPAPKEDAGLRRDGALQLYPIGTALVREHRAKVGDPLTYVWGAVRNFVSPYWRVRYEDGEWEQMTRAQVKSAIQLAGAVRDKARRLQARTASSAPEVAQGAAPNPKVTRDLPLAHARSEASTVRDTAQPQISLIRLPRVPSDFGSGFEGDVVWYHFPTGWSRGTLKEHYPSRSQYTFDVLFDGEKTVRRMRLRPGDYRTPKNSPHSSWNVLAARPVPSETSSAI